MAAILSRPQCVRHCAEHIIVGIRRWPVYCRWQSWHCYDELICWSRTLLSQFYNSVVRHKFVECIRKTCFLYSFHNHQWFQIFLSDGVIPRDQLVLWDFVVFRESLASARDSGTMRWLRGQPHYGWTVILCSISVKIAWCLLAPLCSCARDICRGSNDPHCSQLPWSYSYPINRFC